MDLIGAGGILSVADKWIVSALKLFRRAVRLLRAPSGNAPRRSASPMIAPGRSVQERPIGKDSPTYFTVSHQEAAKVEFGVRNLRTACPAVTNVRWAVSFSTTRVPPMNDRLS